MFFKYLPPELNQLKPLAWQINFFCRNWHHPAFNRRVG